MNIGFSTFALSNTFTGNQAVYPTVSSSAQRRDAMPSSVTQPMRGTDKSFSPAVPPNVRNNPKRTRKGTLKDDKPTVPSSVASSDSNWYAVSSYSQSSLSSSSSISSVEEDSPSKLARRCHNNSLATWRRLRVSGSPSKKNCARIRRSPQRKHLPRRRTRAQPLPQRVSSSIHLSLIHI